MANNRELPHTSPTIWAVVVAQSVRRSVAPIRSDDHADFDWIKYQAIEC